MSEGDFLYQQQSLVGSGVAVGCTVCSFDRGGLLEGRGGYPIFGHAVFVGIEKCLKGPCIFDANVPPLTLELVVFLLKTPRYLCQLEPELTCSQTCTGNIFFLF